MTLAEIPPAWVAGALCAQTDPELFFPEKGHPARIAKAICAKCDVIDDCRAYALEQDVAALQGVWGGLTQGERRKIRADLGLNVALQPCGTRAAYIRHRANDEHPCDDCQRANVDYHAARAGRAPQPGRTGRTALPEEHGTARGYRQHRRTGTATCAACRAAWTAYCAGEREAS
jgi:WhiB family redox-sensing transcriptional regulator